MNLIVLTLILAGATTHHNVNALTFVRDHGRDIAMYTEGKALIVCAGHMSAFNLGTAIVVADRCAPDSIFLGNFQ